MAEPIRFSAGCTPFSAEERGSTREALQDLFAGRVTTQSAADALVRSFLESESSLEDIFEAGIWDVIVAAARELPEHHNKLVELLVYFSGLPPAKDDKGEQRKVYGERIWQDLPTFGWDMNREWNGMVSIRNLHQRTHGFMVAYQSCSSRRTVSRWTRTRRCYFELHEHK